MTLIRELTKDKLIDVVVRDVPRWPPLTKEQYKDWNQYWPTTFSQNDFEIITHSESEIKFIDGIAKNAKPDEIFVFTFEKVLFKGSGVCNPKSVLHGVIRVLEDWPKSEAYN